MSIREAFRFQAHACGSLGSPFMERLMLLAGDRLTPGSAVAERVLNWPGDYRTSADSVPLRLAGGLHALKLEGLALEDVYPPATVSDDALWTAVEQAMVRHETRLLEWLDSAPQTNEVRRAAAILPALATIATRFPKPLSLIELGASGGLNLQADQMALDLADRTLGQSSSGLRLSPDWSGPLPEARTLNVVSRRGVDLNPIDPTSTDGQLRLLAYLWPDQPERIERTRRAIALATTHEPVVTPGDAADELDAALTEAPFGTTRVIYHTVAWQYFPAATKARATDLIETAAEAATAESPLAWFGMEADDADRGAALTLRLWPGSGVTHDVGRADFHGRWIDWKGLPPDP